MLAGQIVKCVYAACSRLGASARSRRSHFQHLYGRTARTCSEPYPVNAAAAAWSIRRLVRRRHRERHTRGVLHVDASPPSTTQRAHSRSPCHVGGGGVIPGALPPGDSKIPERPPPQTGPERKGPRLNDGRDPHCNRGGHRDAWTSNQRKWASTALQQWEGFPPDRGRGKSTSHVAACGENSRGVAAEESERIAQQICAPRLHTKMVHDTISADLSFSLGVNSHVRPPCRR